jgi:hypothetical protein
MLISSGETDLAAGLAVTVDDNLSRLLPGPFWIRRALLGEAKTQPPGGRWSEWFVLVVRTQFPGVWLRIPFAADRDFPVTAEDPDALKLLQKEIGSFAAYRDRMEDPPF